MKKKKSFLLIELLICFALISLTLIPLIKYPFTLVKASYQIQEKMERIRLSEVLLADTIATLSKKSWDDLPSSLSRPLILPAQTFRLNGKQVTVIPRVSLRNRERPVNKMIYRLLSIELVFPSLYEKAEAEEERTFTHYLLVGKEKKNET